MLYILQHASSSLDQAEAAQSSPEKPRSPGQASAVAHAAQSSPRITQSSPEHLRAAQTTQEQPRAAPNRS